MRALFARVRFFKVLSLADSDYFFDSLRQITDWSKKNKMIKEGKSYFDVRLIRLLLSYYL